jgi:polysaccharide export outer membrane protein
MWRTRDRLMRPPLWLAAAILGLWAPGMSEAVEPSEAKPAPTAAYALGPEDVVQISVWKDEHLTREVVVRPDGMVSFPLVGDVQAEGKTAEELKAEITTRLSRFIPKPSVSVSVAKVVSYKVYVIGRVNRPGEFLVGHYTDVMQALSLAGGVTPFASENQIKVLRRVNGAQVVFPFAYGDALKGKGLEQNIILQRGDVVMVP